MTDIQCAVDFQEGVRVLLGREPATRYQQEEPLSLRMEVPVDDASGSNSTTVRRAVVRFSLPDRVLNLNLKGCAANGPHILMGLRSGSNLAVFDAEDALVQFRKDFASTGSFPDVISAKPYMQITDLAKSTSGDATGEWQSGASVPIQTSPGVHQFAFYGCPLKGQSAIEIKPISMSPEDDVSRSSFPYEISYLELPESAGSGPWVGASAHGGDVFCSSES